MRGRRGGIGLKLRLWLLGRSDPAIGVGELQRDVGSISKNGDRSTSRKEIPWPPLQFDGTALSNFLKSS